MNGLKLEKIQVKNYRSFNGVRDCSLNKKNTLFVGKNNSGKTSLIKAFESINTKKMSFNEFNMENLKKLCGDIVSGLINNTNIEDKKEEHNVRVRVYLSYDSEVDFRKIFSIMPSTSTTGEIVLEKSFDIVLLITNFKDKIIHDGEISQYKVEQIIEQEGEEYINFNYSENDILSKILNCKFINANRNIDNKSSKTNNALTNNMISKEVEILKKDENFMQSIMSIKGQLENDLMSDTSSFTDLKNQLNTLGEGIEHSSNIQIKNDESSLLSGIMPSLYTKCGDGFVVPEYLNGLGFGNFYSILVDLYYYLKKLELEEEKNALIFMEEIEAFTHPQMQYIFANKINNFIRDIAPNLKIQIVISTHSPHLVTAFLKSEDIKINYISKNNIMELFHENIDLKFIKQYLTIVNCEILFANYIIVCEGDTEMMLMKTFIQKYSPDKLNNNISIIPLSTYAYKFIEILKKIDVPVIIITDSDYVSSIEESRKKSCCYLEAIATSNSNINKTIFANGEYLKEEMKKHVHDINESKIAIVTQGIEKTINGFEYQPRSFEDAFIVRNKNWLENLPVNIFANKNKYINEQENHVNELFKIKPYGKTKKSDIAFQLLINDGWENPTYINKGLAHLFGADTTGGTNV